MKKQLGVYVRLLISSLLIVGLAQAATPASPSTPLFISTTTIAPSSSVLQLQADEEARQSASLGEKPIHAYGIIRSLNNIR
jgi:hypothetical protein